MATLLIRHVMEDPQTLTQTMEKVIRSSTINSNASNTKELHYLLRVLAPAGMFILFIFYFIKLTCFVAVTKGQDTPTSQKIFFVDVLCSLLPLPHCYEVDYILFCEIGLKEGYLIARVQKN